MDRFGGIGSSEDVCEFFFQIREIAGDCCVHVFHAKGLVFMDKSLSLIDGHRVSYVEERPFWDRCVNEIHGDAQVFLKLLA